MPWRRFAFWNALGGLAWAASVGVLAFALGDVVEQIFKSVGFGAAALVVLGLAGWWARNHHARKVVS